MACLVHHDLCVYTYMCTCVYSTHVALKYGSMLSVHTVWNSPTVMVTVSESMEPPCGLVTLQQYWPPSSSLARFSTKLPPLPPGPLPPPRVLMYLPFLNLPNMQWKWTKLYPHVASFLGFLLASLITCIHCTLTFEPVDCGCKGHTRMCVRRGASQWGQSTCTTVINDSHLSCVWAVLYMSMYMYMHMCIYNVHVQCTSTMYLQCIYVMQFMYTPTSHRWG